MPRPYGDDQYAVDMIGHDDEFIQFDVRKMPGNFVPTFHHDLAVFVQSHFAIYHVPQQTFPIARADGDEIRADLGVIVFFQTDGSAVMRWYHALARLARLARTF